MAKPPSKTKPPARKPAAKKAALAKPDRRGCPKGKAAIAGGPGNKKGAAKSKGKIGNPPFVPTDEQRIQVEAYVAAGAQQWLIAEFIGVSEDTLTRHFKIELEHGKQRVDARVGGSIAQKALAGDSEFMRFYAARRAGWSEKHKLAVGGDEDAPPIHHEVSPEWDLSGLSREELKQMKRLRQKARARAPAGS